MQAICAAATNPEMDTAKVEHLIRLHRELEAQEAERSFNAALAAAQAEMTPVSKDAANQQTRSRFATLAQLDRALRPVYSTRGFAVISAAGRRAGVSTWWRRRSGARPIWAAPAPCCTPSLTYLNREGGL